MNAAFAKQALGAASSGAIGLESGGGVSPQPAAVERFQALMNNAHLTPPATSVDTSGGLMKVQNIVAQHDAAAQRTMEDMSNFTENVGTMSPLNAIGESSRLSLELATVNFDFQAKMGVVDASKSAAETLMKNQ